MPEKYQERLVAVKLRIKEINEGGYVVKEGWEANYLLTKQGKKVSRVNLMGVVLDKEENKVVTNLVLDDGSGKIIVRSFEKNKNLNEVGVGEGVLVVGKIRVFNNEKYISPEIIKKIDKNWLKVRSLELEKEPEEVKEAEEEKVEEVESKQATTLPGKSSPLPKEQDSGVSHPDKGTEGGFLDSANKRIIDLIKELDKGEGALIEEVKEKSGVDKAEEIIEKMLKDGEIFQNLSGRVKVL